MMKKFPVLACVALFFAVAASQAYVEIPYSLGQIVKESSTIALVEVTKVDKTKNLIIFKKLEDVKGKHNGDVIKHNIGKGGFHPREWQNIMNWAEEGKKAVFFYQGGASETCIGSYWYQAYQQGDWWGMSHAEPFLLRSYCGNPEKLAAACKAINQGQEVIVPCMQDGNKELLHQRKAKIQLMKASLKRANYDAKRDFVAFGTGDDADLDIPEFKTTVLLPESSPDWRFIPATEAATKGNSWTKDDFDDSGWRKGKAPIGYGEEEINKRQGTTVAEKGANFLFRRTVEVAKDAIDQKGVQLRLNIASDDCADVYLNGELVLKEQGTDHEFAYWNSEIELKAGQLKPGKNLIAAIVYNKPNSSDIYFDAELVAQVPLPKKERPKADPKAVVQNTTAADPAKKEDDKPPTGITVDKAKKTVTVDCAIAPRKLPNLDKIFPIEVIACYPAPKGQKAHETIVTFGGCKPSHVHKALEEVGLKPGKPAKGEGQQATGPEVTVSLEFTGSDGKVQKLPIEKLLVDTKSGKPVPALKWHFTGSAMKNPDPEKDDTVYGADLTGTLIAVFPVTDDTVLQTHLTMKEEGQIKLEIAPNLLPKEGTAAKLIIEAK